MDFETLVRAKNELEPRVRQLVDHLDPERKALELEQIEERTTVPGFWDDPDAAKAHPDMPIVTHRGPHKPGKLHQSSRPGKGQPVVERKNKPTSPTIGKSLNLPILDGPAQIVQYTNDADVPLSKSIEEGGLHVPPARNMRAEREMAGFDTEE